MDQVIFTHPTVFTTVHPDMEKRTSVSSILFSCVIALVAAVSFLLAGSQSDPSSELTMLLVTLGTALSLVAIFRLLWKSKEWVYIPTGSVAKEGSRFFDEGALAALGAVLEDKSFGKGSRLHMKPTGNVRLDYLLSSDAKFAAVQLFSFVPYSYEPASPVCILTGAEAEAFARCLKANEI